MVRKVQAEKEKLYNIMKGTENKKTWVCCDKTKSDV